MRTRFAAFLAALACAAFPVHAMADDQPAPASPPCIAAKGSVDSTGVRGVHVGGRAVFRDANGNALKVKSVSYCVTGGGLFSFALSDESDVVLVISTADGDSLGQINPTSPAESARMAFPKMRKIAKSGTTAVYSLNAKSQLILGVANGRVNFVGAADRLLLEYPNKLGYYLHRLDF